MKKIEAFVKPFTLEAVREVLSQANVNLFTILQAQELNNVRSHAEVYSGTEYETDVAPRIQIVVIAEDDQSEGIVRLLLNACATEQPGSGRIVVTSIERVVDIDSVVRQESLPTNGQS